MPYAMATNFPMPVTSMKIDTAVLLKFILNLNFGSNQPSEDFDRCPRDVFLGLVRIIYCID